MIDPEVVTKKNPKSDYVQKERRVFVPNREIRDKVEETNNAKMTEKLGPHVETIEMAPLKKESPAPIAEAGEHPAMPEVAPPVTEIAGKSNPAENLHHLKDSLVHKKIKYYESLI